MKVKNEYVEIKIGNKTYTKQNMILNTYLNALLECELDENHLPLILSPCGIKLDTPIENVDYDSLLYRQDFDIVLFSPYIPTVIGSKNNVKTIYTFDDNSTFFYKKSDGTWGGGARDFSMFVGRKITAIGFRAGLNNPTLAFLDTSNMNIVLDSKEQFKITRVDNISSDGISQGIDFPLHLANDPARKDPEVVYEDDMGFVEYTMAQLYSVGFGNVPNLMEEEYLIDDIETDIDDNSITFNINRTKKIGHYPSETLYPGFYPTMDNSKYLIFKYRLYRRYTNSNSQFVTRYLDEYYTMSKPNENFGDLEIKLKIERL
jgi:hypothetical protein